VLSVPRVVKGGQLRTCVREVSPSRGHVSNSRRGAAADGFERVHELERAR